MSSGTLVDSHENIFEVVKQWILNLLSKQLNTNLARQLVAVRSNYHIERISGGLSNILYRVWYESKTKELHELLNCLGRGTQSPPQGLIQLATQGVGVRFYSDQSVPGIFIDRHLEEKIVSFLSEKNLSKRVFYRFPGGKIEEWRTGRSISVDEMKDSTISSMIAKRLGELHSIDPKDIFIYTTDSDGATASGPTSSTTEFNPVTNASQLWNRLWTWLHIVMNKRQLVESFIDFDFIQSNVRRLERLNRSIGSPWVVCHCDLLSGNIVLATERDSHEYNSSQHLPHCDRQTIHFIDYEYACIAERGFDLANHFCEMAGFKCDYSKLPNEEFRAKFYTNYLDRWCNNTVRLLNGKEAGTPSPSQPVMRRDGSNLTTKSTVDGDDDSLNEEMSYWEEEPRLTSGVTVGSAIKSPPHQSQPVKNHGSGRFSMQKQRFSPAQVSLVRRLDEEVQIFMPTAHLFWGLWSALKYLQYKYDLKTSPPLNYKEYSSFRLRRFKLEMERL